MKLKKLLATAAFATLLIASTSFGAAGDRYIVNTNQDKDIVLSVNDNGSQTTSLIIDGPTGFVGIGEIAPTAPLQITNASPELILKDSDTAGQTFASNITFKDSGNATRFSITMDEVNGDADYEVFTGSPAAHRFLTNGSVEALVINASQNVSIPNGSLDINAGLKIGDTSECTGSNNVCSSTLTSISSTTCTGTNPPNEVAFRWTRVGNIINGGGYVDLPGDTVCADLQYIRINVPMMSANMISLSSASGSWNCVKGSTGVGPSASGRIFGVSSQQRLQIHFEALNTCDGGALVWQTQLRADGLATN